MHRSRYLGNNGVQLSFVYPHSEVPSGIFQNKYLLSSAIDFGWVAMTSLHEVTKWEDIFFFICKQIDISRFYLALPSFYVLIMSGGACREVQVSSTVFRSSMEVHFTMEYLVKFCFPQNTTLSKVLKQTFKSYFMPQILLFLIIIIYSIVEYMI